MGDPYCGCRLTRARAEHLPLPGGLDPTLVRASHPAAAAAQPPAAGRAPGRAPGRALLLGTADVSDRSQPGGETWTVIQHDGPTHLGLCSFQTQAIRGARAHHAAARPASPAVLCGGALATGHPELRRRAAADHGVHGDDRRLRHARQGLRCPVALLAALQRRCRGPRPRVWVRDAVLRRRDRSGPVHDSGALRHPHPDPRLLPPAAARAAGRPHHLPVRAHNAGEPWLTGATPCGNSPPQLQANTCPVALQFGSAESRLVEQLCLAMGFERDNLADYFTGANPVLLDKVPWLTAAIPMDNTYCSCSLQLQSPWITPPAAVS